MRDQQLANRPSARIVYLSSERFMNEYVQAIRTGGMHEFRRNYRAGIDVLLIDDDPPSSISIPYYRYFLNIGDRRLATRYRVGHLLATMLHECYCHKLSSILPSTAFLHLSSHRIHRTEIFFSTMWVLKSAPLCSMVSIVSMIDDAWSLRPFSATKPSTRMQLCSVHEVIDG